MRISKYKRGRYLLGVLKRHLGKSPPSLRLSGFQNQNVEF